MQRWFIFAAGVAVHAAVPWTKDEGRGVGAPQKHYRGPTNHGFLYVKSSIFMGWRATGAPLVT